MRTSTWSISATGIWSRSGAGFGLAGVRVADAEAPAVDQHQGALRADPAKVGGADAAGRGQRVGGVGKVGFAVLEVLRQLVQQVDDVGVTPRAAELLVADRLDRAEAGQVRRRDARGGDLDLGHGRGDGRRVGGRRVGCGPDCLDRCGSRAAVIVGRRGHRARSRRLASAAKAAPADAATSAMPPIIDDAKRRARMVDVVKVVPPESRGAPPKALPRRAGCSLSRAKRSPPVGVIDGLAGFIVRGQRGLRGRNLMAAQLLHSGHSLRGVSRSSDKLVLDWP